MACNFVFLVVCFMSNSSTLSLCPAQTQTSDFWRSRSSSSRHMLPSATLTGKELALTGSLMGELWVWTWVCMFSLCLGFSLGALPSTHGPKMTLKVVHGLSHLAPIVSWDRLQPHNDPKTINGLYIFTVQFFYSPIHTHIHTVHLQYVQHFLY